MRCKKSSLAFHHRWCGYGWWTDGPTVTCYRCWPRVVLFPDPAGTQAPRYPRIGTAKAGERDIATFSTSHIPATSGIAVDFAFRHSFVPPLIDVSIRSFRVSSKLYLHPSNYFTINGVMVLRRVERNSARSFSSTFFVSLRGRLWSLN